jgi:hypothetical protein
MEKPLPNKNRSRRWCMYLRSHRRSLFSLRL